MGTSYTEVFTAVYPDYILKVAGSRTAIFKANLIFKMIIGLT